MVQTMHQNSTQDSCTCSSLALPLLFSSHEQCEKQKPTHRKRLLRSHDVNDYTDRYLKEHTRTASARSDLQYLKILAELLVQSYFHV